MIKGIILDFNGTLYLDHDLNDIAWGETYDNVKTDKEKLPFKEFIKEHPEAFNDYKLTKAMYEAYGYSISDEENYRISELKEERYRSLAKKEHRDKLSNGFDTFMEYVISHNIPYCIASMAPKSNFDYYLSDLGLNKWFSYDNIVYDDNTYENKNEQYKEACRRMNIDLKDALLFEDSINIINMAIPFGVKNVIYMNTRDSKLDIKEKIQEIKDFTEFDYSIFKN